MTGRVLHALSDVNGDGVGDLAILALEGASSSSKASSYEIHLGTRTPDGRTAFAPSPDIVFRSPGRIQLAVDRHDLDRDGQAELLFTTIDVASLSGGLVKRLKGAMGDDTWLHLEFYRAERGVFGDAANAIRPIALDGAPSHREPGWVPLDIVLRGGLHESRRTQDGYRRAFNRTLLVGDVTGDGRSDLLIETTPWALDAFAGVPGPELFARSPQTVGGRVAQRRRVHLAVRPQSGRQAGHRHPPPVHLAGPPWWAAASAGGGKASGDAVAGAVSWIRI